MSLTIDSSLFQRHQPDMLHQNPGLRTRGTESRIDQTWQNITHQQRPKNFRDHEASSSTVSNTQHFNFFFGAVPETNPPYRVKIKLSIIEYFIWFDLYKIQKIGISLGIQLHVVLVTLPRQVFRRQPPTVRGVIPGQATKNRNGEIKAEKLLTETAFSLTWSQWVQVTGSTCSLCQWQWDSPNAPEL